MVPVDGTGRDADRVDNTLKIAIIGANGLITEALLAALGNHPTLKGEVVLLGDEASRDEAVEFDGQTLLMQDVDGCNFDEIDLLIDTGESTFEGDWFERAREAGCIILDVGGHLPGQRDEPGIVAGINDGLLDEVAAGSVVVLPDAATVQCATLLHPLLQKLPIDRVSLFSCHAVSELGRSGVEEMARQAAQMLNGKPARPVLFPHQVAFNLVPMADEAQGGETRPAERLIESRLAGILGVAELPISVSCCWAPVFYGHLQALHFSTSAGVTSEQVKRLLSEVSCIEPKWDSQETLSPVKDASGSDLLVVGRLSAKTKNSTEFSLWGVADNLRFGIAGNAVKIVELLVKRLFISYS